jgi:hypothetical protein
MIHLELYNFIRPANIKAVLKKSESAPLMLEGIKTAYLHLADERFEFKSWINFKLKAIAIASIIILPFYLYGLSKPGNGSGSIAIMIWIVSRYIHYFFFILAGILIINIIINLILYRTTTALNHRLLEKLKQNALNGKFEMQRKHFSS